MYHTQTQQPINLNLNKNADKGLKGFEKTLSAAILYVS